jgi:C4-dicarboxylate-specific signal transduction histidine kinase
VRLLLGWNAGSSVRIDWVPVQISALLTEVFDSVFGRERGDIMQLHIDSDVNTWHVPEVHLRQALVNVFKNAEQAMAGRNNMKLVVHCFRGSEAGELCINVHDNGPGFSSTAKEQAFDPFFTTKGVDEGTGLGLYISYYLLEQIGGKIQIEESVNGASLTIKIPGRK